MIAYRKYLHARFPIPSVEHCRVEIDYVQKLIEAMNAQGVSTVGELDGWMTFAEAMAPRS